MLTLLLMVPLAYWPAFSAGFIWDDVGFIVEDTQVSSWAGLLNIWFRPQSLVEFHYWPVLYSTFWLEHKLWGFNPLGFHLTNILLHAANTLLLWNLLRRHLLRGDLLGRVAAPGAWLVAAIFAVHPAHAEAVAWVIARKDLLATFFFLLAVTFWLRFQDSKQTGAYLAVLAFYAAGVLSKSVTLTLPAVLLVLAWWQNGRITKQELSQVLPIVLVGLALVAFDLGFVYVHAVHEFEYTFAERLVIASKALWFYAGKLLWPNPLLFMYPHFDVDPAKALNWLGLVAALALAAALWLARHRIGRGPLAGALFFAITLAPVLGLVGFGFMKFSFVADRYSYLPSIGPTAVLVASALLAWQRLGNTKATRHVGSALVAALLIAYGTLSLQRTQGLQSNVGLFRHIVATNPGAPGSYFNLGTLLMEQAPEEAAAAFYKALSQDPDDPQAYINLGSILQALGRLQEAADVLNRAIQLEPDDFEAKKAPTKARQLASGVHYNLGGVLLELQQPTEAAASFQRALALQPDNFPAAHNLAITLQQLGKYDQALAVLREVTELSAAPSINVYYLMGEIATAGGKAGLAAQYYRQVLAMEARDSSSLNQQAAVHFNAGRYAKAVELYQRSIALDPNTADTHFNLGSTFGRLGRFPQAAESFERALALNPRLEAARASLRLARQQLDANKTQR